MTSWPELMAPLFRQETLTTTLNSAAAQTACLVDGGICAVQGLAWLCQSTVTINPSHLDGPSPFLIACFLLVPLVPRTLWALKWCWGKHKGVQNKTSKIPGRPVEFFQTGSYRPSPSTNMLFWFRKRHNYMYI